MKLILLTGGTGGHVYPALTIYLEMRKRKHDVVIVTDSRGKKIIDNYCSIHHIECSTIEVKAYQYSGNIFSKIKSIFYSILSLIHCIKIFYKMKPDLIWSFGSYVSLPGLVAAFILRIERGFYHNDIVITRTHNIAINFSNYVSVMHEDVRIEFKDKHIVGAILRKEFQKKYESKRRNKILIIGGSQGSSVWDILPGILTGIDIEIVHQTSTPEIIQNEYQKNNFYMPKVRVVRNIDNMSKEIQESNLVFSRGGISSICEILYCKKYAVYYPIQRSINNHQLENAKWGVQNDNGIVITTIDPISIREVVLSITKDIHNTCGIPSLSFDGQKNLSDLMENIIKYSSNRLL